jgi:hypothetical protein
MKRCIFEYIVLIADFALTLACHCRLKIGVCHSWAVIFDKEDASLIILAQVDADIKLAELVNVDYLLLLLEFINFLVVNFVHID